MKIKPLLIIISIIFGVYLAAQDHTVIIMDADTGSILRMDNPKMAAETAYPPGSIIKVFSAIFGLKHNIITPSTVVFCKGHIEKDHQTYDCWDHAGHGPMDIHTALAYSCNVYFYAEGMKLDKSTFYDFTRFLRSFGFGQKTGIDLPRESAGSIIENLDTKEIIKNIAGSSRSFLMTPLQVATAFAAIVNGGKLLKPSFKNRRPIIREKLDITTQLQIIKQALQEGSTNGTSSGYFQEIGGFAKTGTAPKPDMAHSHAWFAGYVPIQDRRFVILVFKENGTGGKDAMPIAINAAKQLKTSLLDQQIVSVSLYSLLKPRTVIAYGRFGQLNLKADSLENNQELDTRCHKLEVKQTPNGRLKIIIDGKHSEFRNEIEIENVQQPQGMINLQFPGKQSKDYTGTITIRSNGRYLEIIDYMTLKDYLIGVIGCEIGNNAEYPLINDQLPRTTAKMEETLKCQVILSRTYALKNLKRHKDYDFCDTTHCQHFRGIPPQADTDRKAVEQTGGLVLTYNNQICEIFYHSTCGGTTAEYKKVWENRDIPYLRTVDDKSYCKPSPHYRWNYVVEERKLYPAIKDWIGEYPTGIRIKETDKGTWVKRLTILLPKKREKIVSGEEFHIEMGRRFGWNTIKSANFHFKKRGRIWEFIGKGLGHGVGLCQYGAREWIKKGKSFRDVFGIYFPGTRVSLFFKPN